MLFFLLQCLEVNIWQRTGEAWTNTTDEGQQSTQVLYTAAVKAANEQNMDQNSVSGDSGVSGGKDAILNNMRMN